MKKILIIERCSDCPHRSYEDKKQWYCNIEEKYIPIYIVDIPWWCQLEGAKET